MEQKEIVYRLLKVIESGKEPKKEDIEADFESFAEWMKIIKDDSLATNISFATGGGTIRIVFANGSELTKDGRAYIESYDLGRI